MSDVVIKVENLSKEYRLGTVSHHTMAKDIYLNVAILGMGKAEIKRNLSKYGKFY